MNGSASGLIFGFFSSCFSASWENLVHGTRGEYLSAFRRKTTPWSSYEITSPVTDVPSVKGNVSAPTATNSPQSQRPRIVQKLLRTKNFYKMQTRRERKFSSKRGGRVAG